MTGALPGYRAAPAATYWKRRFVILAIGLSLLAVAAWTLSEALKVAPQNQGLSSGPAAARGGNAGAHGTGDPGHTAPAAGPGKAGQRQAGQRQAGDQRQAGGSAPSHGPVAARPDAPRPSATARAFGGFKPAFCSWHSIVISLSAAQVHYGPGQQPSFSLSVVSTQPEACSFNIGPSHLALVIKEGPFRIWSSADCVNGSGNLVAALHRGVPTVVTINWNRRTSGRGCSGPARAVPAGTYTGYAVDGSLTSGPVPIRVS